MSESRSVSPHSTLPPRLGPTQTLNTLDATVHPPDEQSQSRTREYYTPTEAVISLNQQPSHSYRCTPQAEYYKTSRKETAIARALTVVFC
ncbi:hypothetical protein OPQ81_006334 [Rhizoctonia solani]|nr:hypothetical protein OPQ81_006334 [Rhizoctonia solani]